MSGSAQRRSFLIRIVTEERAAHALNFHLNCLTEHLWPRTFAQFAELATSECLFEAVETTGGTETVVGICYLAHGEEPESTKERAEFGGVYVNDDCRGLGLASALGIIAISNLYAWDPPRGRLIAHVHVENPLPRGMLQHQLGFAPAGQETPPRGIAPKSMKRNAAGDVVGDLFEFEVAKLADMANWIEQFAGSIHGKAGESALEVQLPLMTKLRAEALIALRAGARGRD